MPEIGIHSAEIAGVAQPVQLLPAGMFRGRDGRGPYRLADAGAVIAATVAHYGDALPIDRDHARDFLPAGSSVPAAGWIKSLEARPDGIWGVVEWTAKAAAEIEAREYRFISPVFKHRPDGTITRIERATLTNYPNLVLEAVASQLKETSMDKDLAEALGLGEDATTAQAVEAVQAIRAASLASVAKALGLEATATAAQVEARAGELSRGDIKPDPARFVPMSQFEAMATELGELKSELAQGRTAKLVEAAQAAGKVSPAMADWAKGYAMKDPDGFTAWASAAPVIVAPGAGKTAEKPPAKGAGELDDDDLAVCAAMGLSPDAWKKSLEQEAR